MSESGACEYFVERIYSNVLDGVRDLVLLNIVKVSSEKRREHVCDLCLCHKHIEAIAEGPLSLRVTVLLFQAFDFAKPADARLDRRVPSRKY